ncbi:hypothetical protein FUA23_21680 [Neolewinella aurantiaca]|uniref:Uncharacterized protein n=1 Tax=Neolewinella aurantiaca TaxID=2602767 RepID=A0A5C7FDF0_9BACT|nr:hypothetical protein [Neolewinella aurantiaca]TXF83082.1 hypothetical protein FUA23_21680 [Neolewinella aurantiaca]
MTERIHRLQNKAETVIEVYSIEEYSFLIEEIENEDLKHLEYYSNYLRLHHGERVYLFSDGRILKLFKPESLIFSDEAIFLDVMDSNGLLFAKKNIDNSTPNYRFIYSSRNKKYSYYELNKNFSKSLLKLLPPEQVKLWPPVQIGRYLDGVISIESSRGSAFFYQSLEDCLAVIHLRSDFMVKLKDKKNKIYPELIGLNYHGELFESSIEELVLNLYNLVGYQNLNALPSEHQLKEITFLLYMNRFSWRFLELCYLPLLAFIGEIYKEKHSGDWVLIECPVFKDYMPDISVNGKNIKLYNLIYEVLSPTFSRYIPLESLLHVRN